MDTASCVFLLVTAGLQDGRSLRHWPYCFSKLEAVSLLSPLVSGNVRLRCRRQRRKTVVAD
jgi:hypothetical protein